MMDVPVIHLTMAAVKMGKHLPKDQTRKNVKVVRHLNSDVALMGLLQLRERIWKGRTISHFSLNLVWNLFFFLQIRNLNEIFSSS